MVAGQGIGLAVVAGLRAEHGSGASVLHDLFDRAAGRDRHRGGRILFRPGRGERRGFRAAPWPPRRRRRRGDPGARQERERARQGNVRGHRRRGDAAARRDHRLR